LHLGICVKEAVLERIFCILSVSQHGKRSPKEPAFATRKELFLSFNVSGDGLLDHGRLTALYERGVSSSWIGQLRCA
jgi:hypothetical protein